MDEAALAAAEPAAPEACTEAAPGAGSVEATPKATAKAKMKAKAKVKAVAKKAPGVTSKPKKVAKAKAKNKVMKVLKEPEAVPPAPDPRAKAKAEAKTGKQIKAEPEEDDHAEGEEEELPGGQVQLVSTVLVEHDDMNTFSQRLRYCLEAGRHPLPGSRSRWLWTQQTHCFSVDIVFFCSAKVVLICVHFGDISDPFIKVCLHKNQLKVLAAR